MSLRKKTFALFLVLGISFCVGSYAVLKKTVLPAFEEFERESSAETLVRVSRMLDSGLRALEIMNIEYSAWDDTYEYALGRFPEFADENLDPAYWHSININLMMVFDDQGQNMYTWFGDPVDGTELSSSNELSFTLEPDHPLVDLEATTDTLKGLLSTNHGIMQVVSYPILTSESEGPIAGTLIVGQLLSASRVQDLGTRATANLSIFEIDTEDVPARVGVLIQQFATSGEMTNVEVDDDSVRGYQVLTDIEGNPAAILEVTAPRRITEIGTKIIQTTIIALAVASAIFILAALLFLQKLITTPVTRLTEQILKIRESGDLSVDVGINRSDEVGVLAEEFGQLARNLSDVRKDLEAARDEALATSRAKSEFLARMSHEIRTPMNGVLGMTELLRDTSLDDKQQRFAKTIYESGESLLHIINDILDISKIEAGKIELDIAPFNLQHLIEECLDLLAESAHRKGLELACDIPIGTNVHVRGDPVRLRQILMNLVGNALKFTEQGEVVVRVAETDGEAGKSIFRFEIKDTGIGISLENSAKVFEPFVQEDGSNTRRYGGTGLGLSISRQLVKLMGGDIGVQSAPGEGSTFWFTAELIEDEVTAAHSQPYLLFGKTAFVVDDNQTNREILRHQMEAWGLHVEVACSGSEAIQIQRGGGRNPPQFDIMLLDMAMPGMDGFEATQKIRAWEQKQGRQPTPIIALTAHALQGDRETCLAAGMSDYLSKPFTKAQLSLTLSENTQTNTDVTRGSSGGDAEASSTVAGENRSEAKARILIVDDNDINRQVAQAMLESLGYKTEPAKNGDEALGAMALRPFDAVLMDCHMPVRNGYDTATEIRLREDQSSQARRIPIVAVTADFLQTNRQRCLESGMDDYLAKPFTQEQLRIILDRWLINTDDEKPTQVTVGSDGFSELGETPALASLDKIALDEIRQLDNSNGAVVLREIVVSYCASSTKLMLQLRSAVANADAELVEQLAHSLKGASGQMGAALLASLCEGMIASVRINNVDGLAAQFERAAIEHCAVLSGLDQELQNLAA